MSVSLIHQIFTFKNIFPTRMNISSSENLNVLKHLISRHFILNRPKCVSFTVFSSGWDTYIFCTHAIFWSGDRAGPLCFVCVKN